VRFFREEVRLEAGWWVLEIELNRTTPIEWSERIELPTLGRARQEFAREMDSLFAAVADSLGNFGQ
jgi:hypothetical protein